MDNAQFYVVDSDIDFKEIKINPHGHEQSIFLETSPVEVERTFENSEGCVEFTIKLKLNDDKDILTERRGFVKAKDLNKDDNIMVVESNGNSSMITNFSGADKDDLSNLEELGIYTNKFKVLVRR